MGIPPVVLSGFDATRCVEVALELPGRRLVNRRRRVTGMSDLMRPDIAPDVGVFGYGIVRERRA